MTIPDMSHDVMVLDCGDLGQFLAFTDAARARLDKNIVAADWQWICSRRRKHTIASLCPENDHRLRSCPICLFSNER
jgi:hypothetical protein